MPLNLLAPLTLALLQAAPAAAPASPAAPAPAIVPPPAPATEPEVTPTPPPAAPVAAPVVAPPAPATSTPPPTWYMPNAAPVPVTTVEGPTTTPDLSELKYRRLVFSNFYTLNFGLFPIPSGDFSFFLGTNLRPRKSTIGKDWNTALGYQLTLSVGGADLYYGEARAIQDHFDNNDFVEFFGPIFFHRHTFLAQGFGGRKGRFYYAMGAGAVMWRTVLAGVEGEARLGYAFSAREGSRVKGVFGGQMRLGGAFDGAPLPQFGLFLGFMVF